MVHVSLCWEIFSKHENNFHNIPNILAWAFTGLKLLDLKKLNKIKL